ncbi:MAG TPA: hypothetical protein VH280_01925 [Verrucomicrobiae bacterium]|jgi:hypothetical protein|nr:hypothetical protein [Verrucomicrobiae bacterium]
MKVNTPSKNTAGSACAGTFCFVCICAAIAFVFWTSATRPASRRLWEPVLVATNGDITDLGESRQLEFWTPASDTKDYLHKENGKVVPTETWEVLSNDDANVQFGAALKKNQSVLGYRRVHVWGQGQTPYKPGWWWTVNAFTNYTPGDLARTYDGFWNFHQYLFVEVIDNRGTSGK